MNSRAALALVVGVATGAALGLGGYTFVYARGASYLSKDPAACRNCHVMNEQYDGWSRGSHRSVAACNDCHAPSSFFGKYLTKAENGFFHSLAFTRGGFHEPIQIKPRNAAITEAACRGCHGSVVHQIDSSATGEPTSCIRCHREVGHP
jgi:cytochrome c nitrite reductase small subunit